MVQYVSSLYSPSDPEYMFTNTTQKPPSLPHHSLPRCLSFYSSACAPPPSRSRSRAHGLPCHATTTHAVCRPHLSVLRFTPASTTSLKVLRIASPAQ